MNNVELRDFLYQEIPLSKAMGIEVVRSGPQETEISAPLTLNRNHMDTAFGGSLNSLLILSCYAWLFHKLKSEGLNAHVLIQAGHTDYHLPVNEDLKSICNGADEEAVEKFLMTFKRKSLARIKLSAEIKTSKGKACSFSGEFVAQKA